MSLEVASKGITVNIVSPGFIQTDMTNKLNEIQKRIYLSKIPIGYFGTTSDVANVVSFLSSHKSKYITGQVIHVNGGMQII